MRAALRRRIASTQSAPAPAAAGQHTPTSSATRRPDRLDAPVRSADRSPGHEGMSPSGSRSITTTTTTTTTTPFLLFSFSGRSLVCSLFTVPARPGHRVGWRGVPKIPKPEGEGGSARIPHLNIPDAPLMHRAGRGTRTDMRWSSKRLSTPGRLKSYPCQCSLG